MKLKAFIFYGAALIIVGAITAWIIVVLSTSQKETNSEEDSYDPQVFAILDGAEITADDVNRNLNFLRIDNPNVTQEEALMDLIGRRLRIMDAERRGIEVTKEEIDKLIDESYKPEQLEKFERKNISMKDVRNEIRYVLIKNKLEKEIRNELSAEVKVTDDDVKRRIKELEDQDPYYNVVSDVAYIFIMIRSDEGAAKAKAEKIIKDLENGADFSALAREYSDHRDSKYSGGHIGDFRGLTSDLQYEVLKLRPGQFNREPIKLLNGYHIVMCLDKQHIPKKQFEERTHELLKAQELERLVSEYYQSLREKAKLEIKLE